MAPDQALSLSVFFPRLAGALALGDGSRACLLSSCPQDMTAGTHFLCLVPLPGSVALASDGDRPKPLALCSGSHFHFVSLLSPAKSTTFGLTSSSKSSMPALGHNELSFL